MADQPRGRARGRSRGRASEAAQRPPGTSQPPRQPAPAAAPPLPGGAWGARPPQMQPQAPQHSQPQPGPMPAGRAVQRGAIQRGGGDPGVSEAAAATKPLSMGGGGDSSAGGRGSMRGGRPLPQSTIRTRPSERDASKKGTSGRKLNVTANYFKVEAQTDWCLYQYRVDFSPEEDRTHVRKSLLKNHKNTLGGYIFDGTMMFVSQKLAANPMEVYSTRKSDEAQIRITIKLVGDLAVGDYHYIQFFNILVRMCFINLKLQIVGRNYYDAAAKVDVPDYNLELWPGYLTSIRQHEESLLMCAEISHKVMRKDSVLMMMRDCVRESDYKGTFKQKVLGCIVMTGYNNKTYRVDDVDFNVSPRSTFSKNGTDISYVQYYKERYDITIQDVQQPLLVSRSKPRERRAGAPELLYLIPELCRLTGLTDEMRNNNQLMRGLSAHTRVDPRGRMQRLLAFKDRMMVNKEIMNDFKEWNLKLGNQLVQVPSRVLNNENIYGAGNTAIENKFADWTGGMRSCPMVTLGKMNHWIVICPANCRRDRGKWIESVMKAASGMNFRLPNPEVVEIPDDRVGTYVQKLEAILASCVPDLIMCLVSNNRADRYAAIKKKCCIDRAVPTQVVTARSFGNPKGLMSIATKVAIQMNCKTGGAPWRVDIPVKGLMVAGFDVCHDTTNRIKSYGALVASLNDGLTRYFSAVSEHTTGEELSNDIGANLVKALRMYREVNGSLPARIVIYRDGVGEGQTNYVVEHEVETIKGHLQKAYGGDQYSLAVIIVTKRINTRFFDCGRNPPPGTIIDDVVTLPERYDFFLVSQSVRQGTVTPTSYNVISDTSRLMPDHLQRLTYKLTHLYYNWSGTVRVPAPCQYAHKLAFLVGQSLHRSPKAELADRLYFL